MPTRYYALIGNDRPVDNPYSVFREVLKPHYSTEVWDRETKTWRYERSLATYIIDGEVGAVEIDKAAAGRLQANG